MAWVITAHLCCCILKVATDNMEMNQCGPVSIKLYLQAVGPICSMGHSLRTPVLECGVFFKRTEM